MRYLIMVIVAANAAVAVAQDDGKREFTITGCLLSNGYATFQIDTAKIEAIDGKPTGEAPSAGSASARSTAPKKWVLEGGGNLRQRTGEQVRVVGRSDWKAPAGAAADEPAETPRLDVKSVTTMAPSCGK